MKDLRKALAVTCAAVMLSACAQTEPINDRREIADDEARMYRMYYDDGRRSDELHVRRFVGRLQMADAESKFGPLNELTEDAAGNLVGGWVLDDDLVWRAVTGPKRESLNLLTVDEDGTLSSAFDLDGDRIADIVDVRLADDRRFTFVTEGGREVFELWLRGSNPLCADRTVAGIDFPVFGCPEGGSTTGAVPERGGVTDFLENICAEYYDAPRVPRPGVMAHGFNPPGSEGLRHSRSEVHEGRADDDSSPLRSVRTDTFRDQDGNHVVTFRTTVEYDENGDVSRVTQETVRGDGDGHRVVTDHGADGTTKTHEETFTTDPDEFTGDIRNENPPPATTVGPETQHPGPVDGPFGPNSDLAAWCEAQIPYESGLERAADTDPAAFRVDCDDLARSAGDPDCTIVEWASPEDFDGVLDTPGTSTGCGPFEQPGPDGTCGPASGIERLRGRTAEIMSADLERIEICNPLVCNPGL